MSATLVSLLGGQPSPTLIMAAKLMGNLERIVILTTKDMQQRGTLDDLRAALQMLSPGLAVEDLIIENPFDLPGISQFIKDNPFPGGEGIIADITGATKLMSIALYRYAVEEGHPVYYVDTQHRLIRGVFNAPDLPAGPALPLIPIPVLLRAYGTEIIRKYDEDPPSRQQDLADLIVKNQVPWDSWWSMILGVTKGHKVENGLRLEAKVALDADLQKMLDRLKGLGFLKDFEYKNEQLTLNFCSVEDMDYLKSGKWLEVFAYSQAKAAKFEQVYRQVKLKSVRPVDSGGWDNEIDVLISHQSRLAIIDCKSGRPKNVPKEHLAEINTLAQISGGVFSNKIALFKEDTGEPLASRAKGYGIQVVSGGQLPNLSKHLLRIIGGGHHE